MDDVDVAGESRALLTADATRDEKAPDAPLPTRQEPRTSAPNRVRLALAFVASAVGATCLLLLLPVGSAVAPLIGSACTPRSALNWSEIDTYAQSRDAS